MRARGFTLIELLVAIFITALVAAMGYGAINQAMNSRESLEQRQARLLAVQTTMRVMAQDFDQLSLRPVRDAAGQSYQPVLYSGQNTQPYLTFTRGGWANPAGVQRPALQRVTYSLDNKVLHRDYYPVLDALVSTQLVKRELLDGVTSVTFRYMDVSRQWRDQWPPQTTVQGALQNLRMRPIAIEVVIDTEEFGKLRRVFEVPT
ncbi:MAG TPA: type II secretion system minor pseudopilin GspJ [Steroidobacteraceae bacterium]|jgi:general secretion pathway protein J